MDYNKLVGYVNMMNVSDDMIKLLFDFMITFDNYNDKHNVIENIVITGGSLTNLISFKIIGFNHLYFDCGNKKGLVKGFDFNCEENTLDVELYYNEYITIDIKDILGFNIIHHVRYMGNPYNDVTFEILEK